nr:DUF4192 family protein [Saccharothrix sp.]
MFAAKCAYAGLIAYASREDVARSVAPHATPEILHTRAKRLDDLLRDNLKTNAHLIYDAITHAQRNELHLREDEIIEMGWNLTLHNIRDRLLKLCTGKRSRTAQQVLAHLDARATRALARRNLSLFAICAYTQGDGPLAAAALDNALDSDPSHGLSALTNGFLRGGMTPEEFRGVLQRLQYPPDL